MKRFATLTAAVLGLMYSATAINGVAIAETSVSETTISVAADPCDSQAWPNHTPDCLINVDGTPARQQVRTISTIVSSISADQQS